MDQPELFTQEPLTGVNESPDFGIAILLGFSLFFLITMVVIYVIYAFLLSRIFKKAGVKESIAWIPFYNHWKFLELGGQQGIWAVLLIVPFIGIASMIFSYVAAYRIGLKLGKEGWFVLLAIFFPLVWFIWLGFDDSKWPKKNQAVKA